MRVRDPFQLLTSGTLLQRLATCSSDHTIKIFEVIADSRTHLADLTGHEGPVRAIKRLARLTPECKTAC